MLLLLVLSSSVYGGNLLPGYSSPGLNSNSCHGTMAIPSMRFSLVNQEELPEDVVEGIVLLREEEKLARDVYQHLYDLFPLPPFENISRSEQAHMNAIMRLLEQYNLPDPVVNDSPGHFNNTSLQQLYQDLIYKGGQNKINALEVAAFIEEKDIHDLQHELEKESLLRDIRFVYQNLLNASKNHLRVFVTSLKGSGVEYSPEILSKEEFAGILKN